MLYENIFDQKDIWEVEVKTPPRIVEGVEYVYVTKPGTSRRVMMRKDSLKPHQNLVVKPDKKRY